MCVVDTSLQPAFTYNLGNYVLTQVQPSNTTRQQRLKMTGKKKKRSGTRDKQTLLATAIPPQKKLQTRKRYFRQT